MATLAAHTLRAAYPREKTRIQAIRNRAFGIPTESDLLESQLAASAALANDMTTDSVKRLAKAGRVSPQWASKWRTQGKGSPLCALTQLVYHATAIGEHPGVVLAHLHATHTQALLDMTDAELVRRFWQGMGREARLEGEENAASATFAQHGDLDALERAMLAEAAEQQEMAALCRELRKRKIDPRAPEYR